MIIYMDRFQSLTGKAMHTKSIFSANNFNSQKAFSN